MKNQDLLVYIKSRLNDGVSREQIISDLENVGWEKKDIDEAFQAHEDGVPIQKSWKRILGKIFMVIIIYAPVVAVLGLIFASVIQFNNVACHPRSRESEIKSNLRTVSVQAELYYDNNGQAYGPATVAVLSTPCPGMFADSTIKQAFASATSSGSGAYQCAIGVGGQTWAASVTYKDGSATWCVDSTGRAASSTITGNAAAAVKCN